MLTRLAFLVSMLAGTLGMTAHGWHAVHVECKLRGDQLVIEAFFDDNLPAQDAKVEVLDATNALVATGRTDDKGVFRTARPQPGTYTVRVDAGAGHRTKVQITLTDTDGDQPGNAGPSRAELTRVPWLKIGLGLGIIVLVCAGLWLLTAKNRLRESNTKGE